MHKFLRNTARGGTLHQQVPGVPGAIKKAIFASSRTQPFRDGHSDSQSLTLVECNDGIKKVDIDILMRVPRARIDPQRTSRHETSTYKFGQPGQGPVDASGYSGCVARILIT